MVNALLPDLFGASNTTSRGDAYQSKSLIGSAGDSSRIRFSLNFRRNRLRNVVHREFFDERRTLTIMIDRPARRRFIASSPYPMARFSDSTKCRRLSYIWLVSRPA